MAQVADRRFPADRKTLEIARELLEKAVDEARTPELREALQELLDDAETLEEA